MNRTLQVLLQKGKVTRTLLRRNFNTTPAIRSGDWIYRESAVKHIPKQRMMLIEGIGAVMWYWMLYHCWYEPDHLLGDFPYPDPKKWTNKELGISEE